MFKRNTKEQSTLFVHDNPKSIVSEKFRTIRSNIMFSIANTSDKNILVTSEHALSGKSTVSSNIGISYAQAGYNTLIIDGDMRKPTQHYVFQLSNLTGLSNLIINKTTFNDAIKATHIDNLSVLTSGPIPPNPSELIASNKFKQIYGIVSKDYDFIIIDTPPVNTVTDAQLFVQHTKNAVLVIDTEKNDRDEVKKAQELLNAAGAKILGVILNKMKVTKSSSYYYYYGTDSDD